MRIMLTGANGQVGWELGRSLLPLGEVIALTREQCDLSRPETIPAIVQEIKPDVIVNAAAYTAVDKAEEEEALATMINGTAVGVLAKEAKKCDALFIHYSTDYVFDGTKTTPYTEEDMPNPVNAYGRSKLVGEKTIKQADGKYLIFRTSWLYASRGNNFIRTMIWLAKEQDKIKVVADQFGAPTSAELIADITALCLYRLCLKQEKELPDRASGIYHLTSTGESSWYSLAKYILTMVQSRGTPLRTAPEKITPISTSEYLLPAKRPANSRLETQKLMDTFGVWLPQWQAGVDRMLYETLEREY